MNATIRPLDARALFHARLTALSQALSLAWPEAGDGSELHALVTNRLQLRARSIERQLESLGAAVDAGQPLDACWRGYLAAELACEPLFEECLALREGAAAREAGIDGGICRIADRLLSQICSDADISWRRFTVVATGESYTHVSDVIRVRYPDVSTWDLPVVVHELGHHAALRLEQPTMARFAMPFRDLAAAWRDKLPEPVLEEFFADAFAAMTLGPAYACTCLLMRFDPLAAGDATHPSDTARASTMLAVLRLSAEELGGYETQDLLVQLDAIEALWTRFHGAASAPPDGDGLVDLPKALHARLRDALPEAARYREAVHFRVRTLAPALLDAAFSPNPDHDDRIAHALAVAWRARLAAGGDQALGARVSANARRLLDALASPMPAQGA